MRRWELLCGARYGQCRRPVTVALTMSCGLIRALRVVRFDHGERWVRVVAGVLGSERITHFVEGVPVVTYTKPQLGGEAKSPEFAKRSGEILSEGLHRAPSRNPPHRVSEGRSAKPRRLCGQEGDQLQALLCHRSWLATGSNAAC
jgi:hypothetical protein